MIGVETSSGSGRLSVLQSVSSDRMLFMLILALGLALRLYRIDTNELWLDETHSIFIAGNSFGDIIRSLRHDGHPPLYFSLLLLWKSAFGESEISVRLMSVLFGTACLPAIYWLGKNIVNKRIGMITMFLAAVNPLYVYYSQEARMYILLAFFSVLSSGFLWMAITRGRKAYWAAYVIASCLMVYTHLFGWFVLAAGNLFLLLQERRRLFFKLLLHQAIVVIAFLPFVPITLRQVGQAGQWTASWWLATPPALAIPKTLECLGAGGSYPAYLRFHHVSPFRYISYLVFFLLAAVAVSPFRDRTAAPESASLQSEKLFLLLNLFVPLILPFAISFVKPIYLVGRYEIMVFPFYALLIGLGIGKLRRLALPALAVIAMLASYSLYKYYVIPTPAFEREAVRFLSEAGEEGDVVVVMGLRLCPFEYYMRREGADFRLIPYPSGMREHPGWIDYRLTPSEVALEAKEAVESAIRQSRPGRPIWLLTYPIGWMNDPLYDQFDLRLRHLASKKELAIVSFTMGSNL